mgnify:CR=1 FL=1
MTEKDIEQEMARIYDERGGIHFPTDEEFDLLEMEAINNLNY